MKTRKVIIAIIAVWGLYFSSALAIDEERIFQINSAVVISNPDTQKSRLLAMPPLEFPDTMIVMDRATLELWAQPQTAESTFIALRVYPITTPWSAGNVTWASPWISPGGDYNEAHYGKYAVCAPGTQSIEIDMTSLCSRWANGSLPYHGFLIEVSESSRAQLTFPNGPFAIFKISYARMLVE